MTQRDEVRQFDIRTLDRSLRKGLISRKDYDKFLKGLPDRADNAVESKPDTSDDGDIIDDEE